MARPFSTGFLVLLLAASLSCELERPRPVRPLPLLVVRAPLLEAPSEPVEEPAPPPVPGDGVVARAAQHERAREAFEGEFPYHGVAFHMLSQVFTEPRTDGPLFGYMRRGSQFRAGEPVKGKGCGGRFYPVEGGGYVCDQRGFILGRSQKTFSPAPEPADLYASLPYAYAKTLADDVPQYYRLPTAEEELRAAAGIAEARRLQADAGQGAGSDVGPQSADAGVASADTVLPDYVRMAMRPGFYVSLDGVEQAPSGKAFARTVRGAYVELSKLKEATPSPYAGHAIRNGLRHSLGLTHFASAQSLRMDPDSAALVPGPQLPRFSAVTLTGQQVTHERRSYLATDEGLYVEARAVRVATKQKRPTLVPAHGRWIDIDLDQQVLVAYEGDVPVFATLVSTGKPGFETPTGLFRIHAKHVSTTMDGADGTDEMYSIEDVPWTMYFQGSLALHGAFWHDRFGRVRSHGCVNLSPNDARHLFEWSTPAAPPGFHGVQTDLRKHGTYVSIHRAS